MWTDKEQLASALSELLLNGLQSGSKENIRLNIHVDDLNGRLVMQVLDKGSGMDGHTLEHAFDPFFSVKPAGRRPGLGLSRARRLAQGLGGEIELQSSPGQGTTAALTHPLAKPAAAATASGRETREEDSDFAARPSTMAAAGAGLEGERD